MNRRVFIERSALAAGGLAFGSLYSCSNPATVEKQIGIQLYTLKELFEKDVKGTLKLVADTGFKQVEAYGYNDGSIFGMSYGEFASEVKRLGLELISGHYGTGQSTPEKPEHLQTNGSEASTMLKLPVRNTQPLPGLMKANVIHWMR